MFNFNELTIVHPNEPHRNRGSFVGIRKDKYLDKMVFTLPKGFDNFEHNYENVKNLFFSMYRTFEKFRQNGEKYLDNNQQNKDNARVENNRGAYVFTDEENNTTVLYSKIDLIDNIFKTYQELEIESLIQELGLIEDVDYSKIENYLDKGVYLNNNAIFIEHMIGYRNIVRGVPSELIEIFCYIYKELANELEKEISEQIKEIAFNFSYKYLSPEQSLFSEYSFDATISVLKDCLDNVHKTTAYKNYQYWDIYEAVEYFLYGSLEFDKDSQQGFWGINNFSYVWEEMCNYMVANHKDYHILYCDSGLPLSDYKPNLTKDYVWIDKNIISNNPFYIDFNGLKRWIRPDVIYGILESNETIENDMMLNVNFNRDFDIKVARKSQVQMSKNKSKKDSAWITISHKSTNKENFKELYSYFQEISQLPENSTNKKRFSVSMLSEKSFYIQKISEKYFNELINNFKKFNYVDILTNKNKEVINKNILMDWKYYSYDSFSNSNYRLNDRVNESIIKSLLYEFCLSQIIEGLIDNQFGIPYYHSHEEKIIIGEELLDCNMSLIKINFSKIQEIYLNG